MIKPPKTPIAPDDSLKAAQIASDQIQERFIAHKEKYSVEHDLTHDRRELRDAAICFLKGQTSVFSESGKFPMYSLWPFEREVAFNQKMATMSYRQRLVEAIALLRAELEREILSELGYSQPSQEPKKQPR